MASFLPENIEITTEFENLQFYDHHVVLFLKDTTLWLVIETMSINSIVLSMGTTVSHYSFMFEGQKAQKAWNEVKPDSSLPFAQSFRLWRIEDISLPYKLMIV